MKSALYVASVTKWYRQFLDADAGQTITAADLETVFSRRTTTLYLNREPRGTSREPRISPIDPTSLGHLGTPIGTVKRVTKDREGRAWLRFHTSRALEKHDGLQFANPAGGKPFGLGVGEMRSAISRVPVFEVAAGTDVEIALPDETVEWGSALRPGVTVYCSMSNAVKRMFPAPQYRESDYLGTRVVDVAVTIAADRVTSRTEGLDVSIAGSFESAKNPEKTFGAVEKAFGKLGGSDYRLGKLTVTDGERRFVPASILNDLRRDLVEKLEEACVRGRRERIAAAQADDDLPAFSFAKTPAVGKVVKIRAGQLVPPGDWYEIVVAINAETTPDQISALARPFSALRLALPVWTGELAFNTLRNAVKRFVRAGAVKWEASDLATLRLLKQVGVEDITADWTLYCFNSRALAAMAELGVRRFVASPENGRANLQYLAESGCDVEMLVQQSTPLFVSLTKPMQQTALSVYARDGLWVTTRSVPRTFEVPSGAWTRVDLSWDVPS